VKLTAAGSTLKRVAGMIGVVRNVFTGANRRDESWSCRDS
jgi:hypothetical protein